MKQATEGLSVSTPNLVCGRVFGSPQKPIVFGPPRSKVKIIMAKSEINSPKLVSELVFFGSNGTWKPFGTPPPRSKCKDHFGQNGGQLPNFFSGLVFGSPRNLLFLDPLGQKSRWLWLKQKCPPSDNSRMRLISAGQLCLSTHHSCFELKRSPPPQGQTGEGFKHDKWKINREGCRSDFSEPTARIWAQLHGAAYHQLLRVLLLFSPYFAKRRISALAL